MGRRALGLAVVWAAVVAGGAGCDWRDFDALKSGVPAMKVSAPSGYGATQDFGQVVLPVAPPADGSAAARFLVSAVGQTALAVVNLDVHGNPSGQALSGTAFDDLAGDPVWSMAEVRGTRQALLGAPDAVRGSLILVDLDRPYAPATFFTASEPQLGSGVAAGALGGAAADDLVALSATTLHVFVDGQTTGSNVYYTDTGGAAQCPIFLSDALPRRFRVNRPVVIASLLAGGGRQLAVGTPVPTGAGAVSIFTVDTAAAMATCALTLAAPNGESQFGQALAVGDFDGDGVSDLLVGAGPTHVYLYRGPIATATPTATITPGPQVTGLDFGGALAAVDLDGDGRDEALIADPDATVSGQATAGNVVIRTGPALATQVMPTPSVSVLADRNPSASEAYGAALAVLPFCAPPVPRPADAGTAAQPTPDGGAGMLAIDAGSPTDGGMAAACVTTRLPLVGAASSAFTYFTLDGLTDPRAK